MRVLKLIQIFLLILLFTETKCQLYFHKGDSLHVWANKGLNIRETNSTNSEILTTIPYGEIVSFLWHHYRNCLYLLH